MKKRIKKLGLTLFFFALSTGLHAYTVGQIVTFGQNTYQVLTASAPDFTLCFLGSTVSGELIVPATVTDGIDTEFTVTEVGGNEGYKCNNVTSVVLPETVTKINVGSFSGASLNSMNIPKSVVSISHTAGYLWKKVPVYTVDPENSNFSADSDGALYSKDMTALYSVPSAVNLNDGTYTVAESVTDIYWDAFLQNKNLKKIVLPPNLQSIEVAYPSITFACPNLEAFEVASGGTTIFRAIDGVLFDGNTLVNYPQGKKTETYTVPEGVTEIAEYAIADNSYMKTIDLNDVTKLNSSSLSNNPNLETVTLPTNLSNESIDGAIVSCTSIKAFIVPEDCVNFAGVDGVVFSKDMKTLYFYPPNKEGASYSIPESVEKIGKQAFRRAKWLTEMEIPKGVNDIGDQAFGNMPMLETVTFEEPSTIESFGSSIFYNCALLTEVTLPSSLVRISNAFNSCSNLKIINVPDGSQLKTIERNSFITNKALEEFNFLGSCELETIGTSAFANLTKLTSFDVPATVTQISSNAFSGCSSLATVMFADDALLKSLGAGAFADCSLTAITIPESVARIGAEVFRNCSVLEKVNLSANITYVDPQAFKFCYNLDEINVDKDNTVYSSVDGYLLSADKETLMLFPPGKANSNFTLLPPSITTIGDYAFYACEKLENVIIPNKVTKIGKRAFGLCSNLNTVTFLCDEMIDPANIDQEGNSMSFDDGTNVAPDMFKNINTYVRRHLQDAFANNDFYQKFNVVGTSFFENGNEYLPVSRNTVDLLSVGSTDYTFVVPQTATGTVLVNPGEVAEQTYAVHLIGDYAFQSTPDDVKEVVVKQHIEYIGAKAFMTNINENTSTIEKVFFIQSQPTARMLSTTRFELDETGNNYNEFAASTNVYVKKSALPTYQSVWTKQVYDRRTHSYAASPFDFTSQLDFKIPDVTIGKKYSTFAREFDTDFSDYFAEMGRNDIGAFVAKKAVKHVGGDYGESEWHVKMTSVDMHGGYSGSYGYVPAYTGVLLKVLEEEKTDNDFYYTIGEQDEQQYSVTDNIMNGVTVNYQSVEASATDPIYVIQGGVFRKATSTINNFPVHKAYMRLGEELPAGAKVMFVFDDEVTSIGDVELSGNEDVDSFTYDLQGRRLSSSQVPKGVYIQNGRKFVVK